MHTVLIIDDNDLVRNYLMRLVTMLGYLPFCAATCEECRHMLSKESSNHIDIIISDIILPDGPEDSAAWVEEVKRLAAGRPLIVISGEASEETMNASSEAGEIMATLTKPFELVFLKELLKRADAMIDGTQAG